MVRRLLTVVLALGIFAIPVMAQGRGMRGAAGFPAGRSQATGELVTLTGTVTSVKIEPGIGMPSIAFLDDKLGAVSVILGPYRLLTDQKFDIAAGMRLEAKVFSEPRFENTFAAVEITNPESGQVVTLGRMGAGMRGGGMGRVIAGAGRGMVRGSGFCAGCAGPDRQSGVTLTGKVEAVAMAAGQGMPSFLLQTTDGAVTIFTGPYWILQQAGFRIAPEDILSVDAYPSLQHDGAYVAARIVNLKTNESIQLRDEDGFPLGGPGPRRGIRR